MRQLPSLPLPRARMLGLALSASAACNPRQRRSGRRRPAVVFRSTSLSGPAIREAGELGFLRLRGRAYPRRVIGLPILAAACALQGACRLIAPRAWYQYVLPEGPCASGRGPRSMRPDVLPVQAFVLSMPCRSTISALAPCTTCTVVPVKHGSSAASTCSPASGHRPLGGIMKPMRTATWTHRPARCYSSTHEAGASCQRLDPPLISAS
jgi:hypothetical protein